MASKPFKRNLSIIQGATFDEPLTWRAGTPAVAVDLTGCTARMHIRPELNSEVVLAELTTENGGITLGGTAGTIRKLMSATATAALAPAAFETAVYDVEVIFADGFVRRLLEGSVSLSPEVTRA